MNARTRALLLLAAGVALAAFGLWRATGAVRCVYALAARCESPNPWFAWAGAGLGLALFGVVLVIRSRRGRIA